MTSTSNNASRTAGSNGTSRGGGRGGGSVSAVRRILEMGDIEFATNEDLTRYCRLGRDLGRTLGGELEAAAYELEARLSTMRTVPGLAKIRARKVARPLLVAAESSRILAAKMVECHGLFVRLYEPELDAVRRTERKPRFEVVDDGGEHL